MCVWLSQNKLQCVCSWWWRNIISATVRLIDAFLIVFGQQWSSVAQRKRIDRTSIWLFVLFTHINSHNNYRPTPEAFSDPHLTGVVQNTEHQFVFVLFGFGEFNVTGVGVQQLVHEGNISGFGEPALLIQQGQDAGRVVLQDTEPQFKRKSLHLFPVAVIIDQGYARCLRILTITGVLQKNRFTEGSLQI